VCIILVYIMFQFIFVEKKLNEELIVLTIVANFRDMVKYLFELIYKTTF